MVAPTAINIAELTAKPKFNVQILDLADCFATAHIRYAKCGLFEIKNNPVGTGVLDGPCPLGLCSLRSVK